MIVFVFGPEISVADYPDPEPGAIPVPWIGYLAHETDHAVHTLEDPTQSADRPVTRAWEPLDAADSERPTPDETSPSTPPADRPRTRSEQVAAIAESHSSTDRYILVDDTDVDDAEKWDHYSPSAFVSAIDRDEFGTELSSDRGPVPDGGRPLSATLVRIDPSTVSSFLADHADAQAVEIRYDAAGEEQTVLLHDASLDDRSVRRPAAAPALECIPVSPVTERFTVRLDAIDRLAPADPPTALYTDSGQTPPAEALGLRRLAEVDPESVPLPQLLSLLNREDGDPDPPADAMWALRSLAPSRPADCRAAILTLRTLLETDEFGQPGLALSVLRELGEDSPADIAPAIHAIAPYLESDTEMVRREASRCVATIAEEYPGDALDALPRLATVVADGESGREYAVHAVSLVSRENPTAVKPMAGTLAALLVENSLSGTTRVNASAALGRVVSEYPGVGVDILDDVALLLESDNPKLRNNAIGLVGDVATVYADVVVPYLARITPLLTVDDRYARINASGVLSRIAEDFPEAVDSEVPVLIGLLGDESAIVRTNACWALGHLGTDRATDGLENLATDDPNPGTRKRAAWALDQIQQEH